VCKAGRRSSGEKGKYKDIEKATYTAEEMKKIYVAYDQEEIRGSVPRYWRM